MFKIPKNAIDYLAVLTQIAKTAIRLLTDRPPVANCNTPGYIDWDKEVDLFLDEVLEIDEDLLPPAEA